MATIKEEAQAYKPATTNTIVELPEVAVDLITTEETYKTEEGKDFTIKVVEINGEKFRVPASVLKALKVILEDNPNLQKFKVKKTGTGLNTEYTVIPLT